MFDSLSFCLPLFQMNTTKLPMALNLLSLRIDHDRSNEVLMDDRSLSPIVTLDTPTAHRTDLLPLLAILGVFVILVVILGIFVSNFAGKIVNRSSKWHSISYSWASFIVLPAPPHWQLHESRPAEVARFGESFGQYYPFFHTRDLTQRTPSTFWWIISGTTNQSISQSIIRKTHNTHIVLGSINQSINGSKHLQHSHGTTIKFSTSIFDVCLVFCSEVSLTEVFLCFLAIGWSTEESDAKRLRLHSGLRETGRSHLRNPVRRSRQAEVTRASGQTSKIFCSVNKIKFFWRFKIRFPFLLYFSYTPRDTVPEEIVARILHYRGSITISDWIFQQKNPIFFPKSREFQWNNKE